MKIDFNEGDPSELEQALIVAATALLNDMTANPLNVHIVKIPSHDELSTGVLQYTVAFVAPESCFDAIAPSLEEFINGILPHVKRMKQVQRH